MFQKAKAWYKKQPVWVRFLLRAARLVLIVYLGAIVFLFAWQDKMMFHPMATLEATPADDGLAYEDVAITAEDGVEIHGWYLPAKPSRGLVLHFHGNAGNISHRLPTLQIFHQLGLSVLIIDYRGYGRSEGKISEAGIYRDSRAAWKHATEKLKYPPEKILIFGRSLGGAVAIELAGREKPAALIAESTFTSVPDMGKRMFPLLPRWLCRIHFKSIDRIDDVRCPVLVVHSKDDTLVPYDMGRAIFAAANEPKTFVEISGDHNGGYLESLDTYVPALEKFLDAHLPR